MLRNAMLAALATAAAGAADEWRSERPHSTPVDDRSQKEQSVSVLKNLAIVLAQQQQQLVQCNEQLLGREHAQGNEDRTMMNVDVDGSAGNIENDNRQQYLPAT